MKKLGVRIAPDDVADVVWRAANPPNRWARGKVHYGVSGLIKTLCTTAMFTPDRVKKNLARLIAG